MSWDLLLVSLSVDAVFRKNNRMAYRTGAKGNGRNFGLNGGPGKGSADRTTNRRWFREGLERVKMSGSVPASQDLDFSQRGAGRFVKKYS